MIHIPIPVDDSRDKDGVVRSSKYLYGCKVRDNYLLRNPASLPLYGNLARKALIHYAGEVYNPHTIHEAQEVFIRQLIKMTVEHKITNRLKVYDWEWIDNFFKKVISDYYELNLPYNLARIEQGLSPEFRAIEYLNIDLPN